MTGPGEGYTGRDYGSHAHQVEEQREACGLPSLSGSAPVDPREEWEQDLQDDLRTERPVRPRMPRVLKLRRINTTDLRKAA